MAEVMSSFPSGLVRGIECRYDKYLDGQIWKLTPASDFPGLKNMRSLQGILADRARKLGLRAVTRTNGDVVYVQAFKKDGSPLIPKLEQVG